MFHQQILAIFLFFLTCHRIHTLDFQARCPDLFLYEGRVNEPDRWYGVIAPNTNSSVSSFRLILDRPAIELGLKSSMAYISTRDNQEFLIKVPASSAQEKQNIARFYVRYNLNEPAPNLIALRINEKTVCPNVTIKKQLRTSPLRTTTTANVVKENESNLSSSSSSNNNRSDDVCGTVVAQPKRLHSSQTTYEGEFPWQAVLTRRSSVDERPYHYCGATLISKYHVLTCGHCVTNPNSRVPLERMDVEVYIGIYSHRFYNYNVQRRSVLKYVVHPQYNPLNSHNNMAIIKMVTPADITDYIRPVCLWQDSIDVNSIVDKLGTVVGLTYNEIVEETEHLEQVKMPIFSPEKCATFFNGSAEHPSFRRTYCAGRVDDASLCSILSPGNGMVLPTSDSNQKNPRWQLRGIAAFTGGSTELRCDPSSYFVFEDVAVHLDWIRSSLQ